MLGNHACVTPATNHNSYIHMDATFYRQLHTPLEEFSAAHAISPMMKLFSMYLAYDFTLHLCANPELLCPTSTRQLKGPEYIVNEFIVNSSETSP
jgi:hypothetical protein